MKFPTTYNALEDNIFSEGEYKLVPIRYEDRIDIMQWRNEQLFHLRQKELLTEVDQNNYFNTIVSKLFSSPEPNQLLFSYLKNDICIGYGGLVHINWIDKNAEISFVLNTSLENEYFQFHWSKYLALIEKLAFTTLNLHKIYTYAYNLRPQLFEALEMNGYHKEATLKEHCFFNNQFIDVIIHEKRNQLKQHHMRVVNEGDVHLLFNWSNEASVRNNALNSDFILWEDHVKWFNKKINSQNSMLSIFEINHTPIGQIRVDKLEDENYWLIDYSIDLLERGKGYGGIMLEQFMQENNTLKLKAIVKLNNIASQKVFEKLDFIKINEVNNLITYCYDAK